MHNSIRVNTCRINHPVGVEVSAVGTHTDNAVAFKDKVLKGGIQHQFGTVQNRAFGGGHAQLEGITDPTRGSP